MSPRRIGAIAVVAALLVPAVWWSTADAHPALPPAGTTCKWGGTPDAPTGTFTLSPGLTNAPLAKPSRFYVTGELTGDPGCTGTFTYIGQIDTGGTCLVSTIEGRAAGIPGVDRFEGVGVGPLGPARLYDKAGNVVASENANVTTVDNAPHFLDCSTPQGFTGGSFSSVIFFVAQ